MPVLVDCVPYRAKLSHVRCVERWREASRQGAFKTGREDAGARSRGLKQSHCRDCEVGENRALELQARPELANPKFGDLVFNQQIDRESAAPHPQAGSPFPLEDPMKKCPKCKTGGFKRLYGDDQVCRRCYNEQQAGEQKEEEEEDDVEEQEDEDVESEMEQVDARTKAPAPTAPPKSPFHTWLALHDVLEDRKRVAAEAIRKAEEAIATFEREHPEVREEARAKLARLVSSGPVVVPPKAAEA